MVSKHAGLLQQLHEYVDEYINYLGKTERASTAAGNTALRDVIAEIEAVQRDPHQTERVDQATQRIGEQLDQLRQLSLQHGHSRPESQAHQTLAQAFHDYFDQEIAYLAQVSGRTRREQVNLLLGDIIADLNALALHPTEEQAREITADLERKRQQIEQLQRPWQQMHNW